MKKSTKQKIKLLLQDNDSISFGNALRNLFLSFSASKLTYTCLYSPSNSQPPFSLEIIKSILQNFLLVFVVVVIAVVVVVVIVLPYTVLVQ